MFRELRRPKGDRKVLAAQSTEQYLKVYSDFYLLAAICHSFGFMFFFFPIFFSFPLSFMESVLVQLKKKLQLLTLGIGGVGVISAYVSYSPEIAAR